MRHVVADMSEGAQVWMCIPQLHPLHPLLVTVGKQVAYCDALMPQMTIQIHEREGMRGTIIPFIHNFCTANSICYDTEVEAQEALDCDRKRAEEKKAKLKDFYSKVAEEYYNGNIECDTEEQVAYFKAGFVEACMELRNRDYLLKVNPPVPGIDSISRENDLWNRYMKENN